MAKTAIPGFLTIEFDRSVSCINLFNNKKTYNAKSLRGKMFKQNTISKTYTLQRGSEHEMWEKFANLNEISWKQLVRINKKTSETIFLAQIRLICTLITKKRGI